MIFIIIAGILNSIMDVIQFKWSSSIFNRIRNPSLIKYMNPSISWKNKWKHDLKTERFIGSSTVFVFITDFWHLLKMLMIVMIALSIVNYNPIYCTLVDILIYYLLFTIPFQITYYYFNKQNKC